jgi:antiviral defense system Shedu protein SduA
VPDFIVCEWSSVGPDWFIVELESPTQSPLTQRGISQICNHAVEQINDYRTYIEENGYFLRENGWPKLHGQGEGIVVIGRRTDPGRSEAGDRLRNFRRQRVEIVSYDRLLEECQSMQDFLGSGRLKAADAFSLKQAATTEPKGEGKPQSSEKTGAPDGTLMAQNPATE